MDTFNNQKGQVTIFIILGLIILIIGISFFLLKEDLIIDSLNDEIDSDSFDQLNNVNSFVEKCLQDSSKEALYHVFSQGGYYDLDQLTDDSKIGTNDSSFGSFLLPIYYSEGGDFLPTLEKIEIEVGLATVDYFLVCIDNFGVFTEVGYNFTEVDSAKVEVKFLEQGTDFILNYPVKVSFEDKSVLLGIFDSGVDFVFVSKYNDLNMLLEDNYNFYNNQFIVGSWSNLAYRNNYSFSYTQFGNLGSEIFISLEYDPILDDPLFFNLGLQYAWDDLDESVSSQSSFNFNNTLSEEELAELFYVFDFEEVEINYSGVHNFQIEANGINLTYELDTESISISENGLVSFDTSIFENGEYLYYVKVNDYKNSSVIVPLMFNINVDLGGYPKIESPIDLVAVVGEEFELIINVSNTENYNELYFSSDSYLFEINKQTGLIKFIPEIYDVGFHSIRIDVENMYGLSWVRFGLEVVE